MGRKFKTIDAALAKIQKDLTSVIKRDGVELVKDVEASSIDQYVYDVYEPKVYGRTEELKAARTMKVEKAELPGHVSVTNTRSERGRDIAQLVYGGDGYNGINYEFYPKPGNPDDYLYPRDYITPTTDFLRGGILAEVVKDAIERKGYELK